MYFFWKRVDILFTLNQEKKAEKEAPVKTGSVTNNTIVFAGTNAELDEKIKQNKATILDLKINIKQTTS
jgi:hypothetical protein